MKPLHTIEKIALTLSLAVMCAMATTRCTHAAAQPVKTCYSSEQTVIKCYGSNYRQLSENAVKSSSLIVRTIWTAKAVSEYSVIAHPHDESSLAASDQLAHIMPRFNAAFSCVSFCCTSMVRLDEGTFECASCLTDLSANLFQSNHLSLAAYDSTSFIQLGVNHD